MELILTSIDGLFVLKPYLFTDERGYFFESYNQEAFRKIGISSTFVQDNQSCSKKGVIRGLHFQKPPFAQAKLVRVIRGEVLDIAVDLRKSSPTYGRYYSILLSDENQLQFFIPEGFAHGFVSLKEDTLLAYKCSAFYNKAAEACIRFDDPTLNIDWKTNEPIVNAKDLDAISFDRFQTPFL
jgi:dTDP-4-dehydrorhamnose 3,5-epimerase